MTFPGIEVILTDAIQHNAQHTIKSVFIINPNITILNISIDNEIFDLGNSITMYFIAAKKKQQC